MSIQSVVTVENFPNHKIVNQFFREVSVKLLKTLKYEVGCISHHNLRTLLRLDRLICSEFCYLDDEDKKSIREKIIRETINDIYEL